jgi:hypothetical protein
MATDINGIVTELQEQLKWLSSRAAQLAGQLTAVIKERDELQEKLDEQTKIES